RYTPKSVEQGGPIIMKITVLLILSLLIFSSFALNAYSQKELARASRAAWAADPNAGVLNMPIGSNSSSGETNPKQIEETGLNQTTPTEPVVSNETIEKQPENISIPGNWSLKIADVVSRNATLTLFQNGDTVFGKGSIMEDNNTITVAAGGSVNGNKLNLDLITLEKMGLYRLSMTVSGDTVIGSYTAFSTIGSSSSGPANGSRT
ncbi:MAG: hypothetical protein WAK60_06990, partial [Sedimentisphaerales bacterium]